MLRPAQVRAPPGADRGARLRRGDRSSARCCSSCRISARDGSPTSFVDALFTATSAVCVTGLTVRRHRDVLEPFGQVVILLLIQLGGLGIMIFAGAHRPRARAKAVGAVAAQHRDRGEGRRATTTCAGSCAASSSSRSSIEAATSRSSCSCGSCSDTATAVGDAAWHAVFHAVSSFNNAGFALYSDNLDRLRRPIRSSACRSRAAIILGGLGFPVIMQLRKEFRRPLHWSMNTKLVLWGTVVLLVARHRATSPCIEWDNPSTLGALDPGARVLAGFFQSVQTRTAGFNSVDIGAMHAETLARHGRADVHRRRARGHGGRHQGHDVRRAVLHHR